MRLPDAYSFQARFVPMLVTVLPPIVLLGAGIVTTTRLGIASGLVLTVASATFSQLGRDRGKQLEPDLWASWGGAPTLRRLRYAGAIDRGIVDRLHARIADVLDDPLPTADEESADPAAADRRYTEATRRLIARATDHDRFPLVFAENINYGMRRNLLGLRSPGLVIAAVTTLAAILLILLSSGHPDQRIGRYAPALVVAMIELLFWRTIVSADWVKPAAEAYADRLMESTELLQGKGAASTGGS
jgi:hypothetical protein